MHRGFQDWAKQSGTSHVYSENRYPKEGTRERKELEGATQWMYDICSGKKEMPKQFFDPKTGLLNIPKEYTDK